jgi:hypothetical protein
MTENGEVLTTGRAVRTPGYVASFRKPGNFSRKFFEKNFRENFTGIFFGGKSGIFFQYGKDLGIDFFAIRQVNRMFRGTVICCIFGSAIADVFLKTG